MKIKSIIAAALVMTAALALTSCGAKAPAPTATPAPTPTAAPSKSLEELTSRKDYVEITVNVNGEDKVMKAELYPDLAPETVANFEKLASENFYDGLIFHRVISGFMIQGGGYSEDMTEKETASIKGEFKSNGFENPLKHEKGVLSMARTMQSKDSASSQFFIMHEDYPSLDGEYAAFGKVTEGLEVIDEIASQPTKSLSNGMSDVPENPIVIKSINISAEG